jgi:cobalt-zinc-cadmium efflux system outer membrane protein
MERKICKLCWLTTLMFCVSVCGIAQDTLRLTLQETERQFLQHNFLLLAARYQVSVADAAIIQAKLYPNPNFYIDQGMYNPETKKWFDLSSTGQTELALQQVIILAGKRNKQIDLAKINSEISNYQFYDLIRTLRYQLRSSFYSLHFLQEPVAIYDKEIESLRTLIEVYNAQYKKGNIAFKELARLQALQFSLQNERLDLVKQINENRSNLSLLIGDSLSKPITPVVDQQYINSIDASAINYVELVDSALINRYDLKAAQSQLRLSEANLQLQKALRVPDLTLGASYDKAGSYVHDYNSLSAAIDLPFWNRNQGNIRAAQFQINANQQLQSQAELQVRNDIDKAYKRLIESDRLFKGASIQFTGDYENLLDGILRAYQNHTISLLEFIDYYEAYKDSKLQFNRLQSERMDALENLNLSAGANILK